MRQFTKKYQNLQRFSEAEEQSSSASSPTRPLGALRRQLNLRFRFLFEPLTVVLYTSVPKQ